LSPPQSVSEVFGAGESVDEGVEEVGAEGSEPVGYRCRGGGVAATAPPSGLFEVTDGVLGGLVQVV